MGHDERQREGDAVISVPFFCAPCMGNNLAVKVRYALGSRER